MQDVVRLSVAGMGRLLISREVSATELCNAHFEEIARLDSRLRSFVTPMREQAIAAAAEADRQLAAGQFRPLLGIPYGIKDVFETAGVRTTAQSKSLADNIPLKDCAAVAALNARGAVPLGKTATWEFAHGGPSWDILFPPARNPWDLTRSPSGSSSGSAAAVASGLSAFALGTDTGGSIRVPAALCGIVGLKPTYGLVSRFGGIPNSFSQDHVGPMTRTVEDAAIVLQALAGHDPRDPATSQRDVPDYSAAVHAPLPKGIVVGIPYRWFEKDAPVSAEVRAAFDKSVSQLQAMGVRVREVSLPPLLEFEDVKKVIALGDLYSLHRETLHQAPHLLGSNLRGRIAAGAILGARDYLQAQRLRTILKQRMAEVFAAVDFLAMPMSEPAGKLESTPAHALFTTPGFAAAFNVTGHPAISIPNGMSAGGLPLSLQLVARPFEDAALLNLARHSEIARGEDYRFPDVLSQPEPVDPEL